MRHQALFLLLCIIIIFLNSCGFNLQPANNAATPAQPADAPVTITFAAQATERHLYEPLIDGFNQAHPHIQVRFVALGTDQDIRHVVHAADTAVVSLVQPADIASGYLRDLAPFINADPTFTPTDFFPPALQAVTYNNSIYLVPHHFQTELLVYNKDLWERAGLLAPDVDWTWNDLLNAAAQVAQQGNATIPVYGLFDETEGRRPLANELAFVHAQILTTPPAQVQLDTPEIGAVLERIMSLIEINTIYVELDNAEGIDRAAILQMITDQRIGIWSAALTPLRSTDLPFPTGTAIFPSAVNPPFAHSGGYIMSSGTRAPTEAWQWLSFLSHQLDPTLAASGNSLLAVPARRSLAEQNDYWDRFDPETTNVIKAVLEQPVSPALDTSDTTILAPLHQALVAVLNDQQTIPEALSKAQTAWAEQAEATPQPTPPPEPVVVATPAPRHTPPAGATVITFAANTGPIDDRFGQIADSFNQQQQAIFVQVQQSDPSTVSELADLAAQTDCFAWYIPPEPGDLPALLDLQPLIDADAAFDQDDYPPALLAPFQHNGRVYGLPYLVTFRVLVYNQTMFEAANLDAPTIQWTLDDFLRAAQQLTTDDKKQYGFASVRSMPDDLLFFLDQAGASVVKQSPDGPQPDFTNPDVIQAVRFYLDFLINYSPHQRFVGYNLKDVQDDGAQLALDGRIGMWLNFGTLMSSVYSSAGVNTRTAPPPLGNQGATPRDVEQNGLYIAAHSQEPAACWTWLKYLSNDPTALQGMFPARTSIAESDVFINLSSPDVAAIHHAYQEAFTRSTLDPTATLLTHANIEYYWLYRAVDRGLQGQNIERELDTAQVLTQQHLACIRTGGQPRACALQVDPEYDGYLSEP